MEPGRPGHGTPGQHFGPGRVGSRVCVQYTLPGLLTRIRCYKNVLSVCWCAVTVSVFGSSGTGGYQQFLSMFFVVASCRIAKPLLCCIHTQ